MIDAVGPTELERLRDAARTELEDPARWGTTFTLVQTVAGRS